MVFKINIGDKSGKTYKIETDSKSMIDKELGQTVKGELVREDLEGYELEITGTSDKSGFTSLKEIAGVGLKKVLLSYEKGMKKRPRKEGKKKLSTTKPSGLRLRKTVRGRAISEDTRQINLKVVKAGKKTFQIISTLILINILFTLPKIKTKKSNIH